MKKNITLILVFLVSILLPFKVHAEVYKTGDLIPVDNQASVTTELFQYDFVANSSVDDKGNTKITFSSIKNLTSDKLSVSVNILLFNAEKKNIGFLTYCSDKDVSTEYSGFKLNANASTSYYMNVVSRYFANQNTPTDVKYVSILDENKYCHIGGYDKYAGLTIEEINGGKFNMSENAEVSQALSIIKDNFFMIACIFLFMVVGVVFIEGLIINTLHRKMYNHGTVLSFVPIANTYLMVKLAFGSMIAKVYIICFIVSIFVAAFLPILSLLVSAVGGIAFIVVIIKLITKNYGMFSGIENPSVENNSIPIKNNKKTESVSAPVVPTVEEVIAENKEEALDLTYTNGATSFMSQSNEASVESDQTNQVASALGDMFGDISSTSTDSINETKNDDKYVDINPANDSNTENSFINFNAGNSDENNQSSTNVNNNDGESELSKFFQ